ncbi:MAG: DUF3396 domain-containing protein [Propionibacteriaceae bacterium]|nr:DUF3396 domain-containing protein [Propionibacteriaceae bacterium]
MSIHDGAMDCMGDYGMVLTGEGIVRHELDEASGYVEVVFPVSDLERLGEAGLAHLLCDMVAPVDYWAGVAGFCFQHSPYKLVRLWPNVRDLCQRFVGVEITAAERLAYLAERGVPTVNWLTFIGEEHLARLGGAAALNQNLSDGLTTSTIGSGVVLACAGGPRLGDMNNNEDIDIFRRAYQSVRPAQFVDPAYAFSALSFPGAETVEWLTRLAD